ncbi:hypothetical protein GCM10008018_69930 [Paenibacillus marchantiophytorum]|uniref:ADP-ribosylglycohydrolase family protein n=1 Tax=Paenibacillus marchantiophytorum TaxID=1619310 RepID=A0ABQ1FIP9_9BACL|nr:hypothetical protein GCM10008018_69930 [Paenibacillus marchantiophytorum]
MKNQVLAGLLGLCVGDALGVPVEFRERRYLKHRLRHLRGVCLSSAPGIRP